MALFSTLATGYGLQKWLRDMTAQESSLGRLSRAIGDMSVHDLGVFEQMAERMGGSADAAGQSILKLSQDIASMSITANPELARDFQSMGIALADPVTNAARKTKDIIEDLHRWFSAHAGPQAQFMGNRRGFSQDFTNLLSLPEAEWQKYRSRVEQIGVPGEKGAGLSQEFIENLHDFKQNIENIGQTIAEKYLPRINEVLQKLNDWMIASKGDWIKDIEKGIDDAIPRIKAFWEEVQKVVEYLGGWENATNIVLGLWAAGKIAPIVTAIASITGAMLALRGEAAALSILKMPPWLIGLAAVGAGAFLAAEQAKKDAEDQAHHWERGEIPTAVDEFNHPYGYRPATEAERGKRQPPGWRPGAGGLWEAIKKWFGYPINDLADTTMNETKRGFLNTLAMPESGGAYDVKNGNSRFSDFSQFPEGIGPGGTSSAAGRYQFTSETWKELQSKYGFTNFAPETQDKAAWALASDRYAQNTGGRNLEADLQSGGHTADIARALKDTWPSLPGGSQSLQDQSTFDKALQSNTPSSAPLPSSFDVGLARSTLTPAAAASISNDNSRVATSSNQTTIGAININTQQGDPDTIAKGVGASLRKYAFVSPANYGLA